MTSFWSWWVIILTTITFVGTFWLLFANRTRAPADPEQTTGHSADGIEEYDNPLPYWWFLMFLITLVFGVGFTMAVITGVEPFHSPLVNRLQNFWDYELTRDVLVLLPDYLILFLGLFIAAQLILIINGIFPRI